MTPAFDRFVEPARARPQIWRLVLGLLLATAIYAGIAIGVLVLGALARNPQDDVGLEALIGGTDTPGAMLVFLLTFVGMVAGTVAAAWLFHRRGLGSLIGPRVRTVRDFGIAAGTVFAVIFLSLAGWSLFFDADPGLSPGTWLMVLPLALLAVLLQTGAEEILFRGYLQQQMAARFASPIAWGMVPSILFALGHFDPSTSGASTWLIVGATGLFGLMAADLTARTGSIGAAWGFHFANNCYALLVIATNGTLTGLALYRTPYSLDDPDVLAWILPADIAAMVIGWLLVSRLVTQR